MPNWMGADISDFSLKSQEAKLTKAACFIFANKRTVLDSEGFWLLLLQAWYVYPTPKQYSLFLLGEGG